MVCTGKVPIPIVAYVYGKDACWVRAGSVSYTHLTLPTKA